MSKQVHVAVAVIANSDQQILLSLRQSHQHQGDLWEFPGGKVELTETVYDALLREVDEEIGLVVNSAQSFMQIHHDYGDKSVLLDVWLVDDFSGEPVGREGQRLRWCNIAELDENDFPAANVAIIEALKLRVI